MTRWNIDLTAFLVRRANHGVAPRRSRTYQFPSFLTTVNWYVWLSCPAAFPVGEGTDQVTAAVSVRWSVPPRGAITSPSATNTTVPCGSPAMELLAENRFRLTVSPLLYARKKPSRVGFSA